MKTIKTVKITKPIKIYKDTNKKCRECGQPMVWLEGLMRNRSIDFNFGKYVCETCRISCKTEDSKAMKKGRKLAKKYNTPDFYWIDIKHLPIAIQLGILREIQSGKNGYLNKKNKTIS